VPEPDEFGRHGNADMKTGCCDDAIKGPRAATRGFVPQLSKKAGGAPIDWARARHQRRPGRYSPQINPIYQRGQSRMGCGLRSPPMRSRGSGGDMASRSPEERAKEPCIGEDRGSACWSGMRYF